MAASFLYSICEHPMFRPFYAFLLLFAALHLSVGCTSPPPAPEGLDASTSYMVTNFYADDAVFQAGVQGFMTWFDEEGFELIDLENSVENVSEAFTVETLAEGDIAHLPIVGGRNIADAAGIVSIAEMQCSVSEAEALLMRGDQDVLFDDWEGYDRTFVNSRDEFAAATVSQEFASIGSALSPFDEGFDAAPYAPSLLQTLNQVNPSPIFGGLADIEDYSMHLDFRHGVYEIDGEPVPGFAILTFIREGVSGPAGANHLHQSYSVEINVAQGNGTTLRMLAVWTEPEGANMSPDDPIILNYAVTKSREASERMTELCDGTLEVPPEE